jgi:[NiFe] hydrogenase large subunit
VRAVEDAVGVKIPKNARIIRNLLHGAQFQHDHIVHFYHLHALDWVDIVSALSADPAKTAALSDTVSNAPWGGAVYFKNVKEKLQTFVNSGQLGPFENAYWGHSAYKLPPEANLMAAAHYIEALRLQAKAARMHAIFGGKKSTSTVIGCGRYYVRKRSYTGSYCGVFVYYQGDTGLCQERLYTRPASSCIVLQGLGCYRRYDEFPCMGRFA